MAPPKFDDLCKPAKDVLTDDYQEAGYAFKAKAKTNFEGLGNFMGDADGKSGGTLTTAIDFDASNTSGGATPAKLTWKLPKPLGFAGIAFDKLEMDKKGGIKLEASIDKSLHKIPDVKIECKSGLDSLASLVVGANYTGVAEALIKAESNAAGKYNAELAYAIGGGASLSLKSTPESAADVGARYVNGPLTCSATSGAKFSAFTFHGFYKVSDDLKVAATYTSWARTLENSLLALATPPPQGRLSRANSPVSMVPSLL